MLTKKKPHTNDQPVRPRVAVVLAAGLLIVTAFQAALTLGAPLGAAAMGGANPGQLPDAFRLVTGFSTVLWLFAALLVLARGGRALVPLPEAVSRVGTWVLVGLLGLGALMNFTSSSPWERFGWGPFALVMLTLGVVLARSGLPSTTRRGEPVELVARQPWPPIPATLMTRLRAASPTGSRLRRPSALRRIAHLALAIALSSATLLAVLVGGVAKGSVHSSPPTAEGVIPASRPSSDGPIVVAVVLGQSGTDDADALAPYEVFARSAKFSVYTVAATRAPATMNGGLHVVPTYDFADVTSGAARKPDLVVVPAVNDPAGERESELRAWLVQQAGAGARILGVCAGSRVLAASGLLDGRRATSHWSRIASLRESNPRVNWVEGQRYVEDGNITTSAGVSSAIPASLQLVQELAGKAEATKVAEAVRYPGLAIGGPTEIPIQQFSRDDAGVGLNAVLPWFQPTVAVGLADGVGEIDATALFDVYSYASAARLVPVSTGSSITTAHGVVLLTTPAASLTQRASRLVLPGAQSDTEMAPALRTLAERQGIRVIPLGQGNTGGFDAALTDLASSSGNAISRSTAKMMDYPTRPAADDSASPALRAPILLALAIVLAATVGMIPTIIRVLRRRHLNRHNL